MKKTWHSLKNRVTAMLLALICVLGLLPTAALAAGADTIKLERFGMSGVSYQSASLGRCTMHQMYYGVAGKTSVGFCGTKGGGMGTSLIGQTWGDPKPVTDPTVKMMMAYYYAHSLGIFTDKAHALGVDDIWDSGYSWYMNAWVQAIVWRYKDGSLGDPATACAEELMYVWNSLKGASYTSIDQTCDGATFRDRANYILDLGRQDVWGDCDVKEYSFTGAGSAAHPASTVQSVMIGSITVTNEQYKLVVKKVDATNPTKGLAGARFHVESTNGSFSKDIVTGTDGTYTLSPLDAGTYAVTETAAPNGYEIDNAGPEYVVLPNNGSSTVTITFTDTPTITASGKIRKVDADDPTRGLAGAVIKITGVDNNFTGTYTTGAGGALTDVPWDTMPIGSYVAEEMTPPNGYSLSKDAGKVRQEFYWDGKTDVFLVFENDAKVKIQLIKLNDANSPLSGAVFHVLRDGQLIGTEVTDASGKITVPHVTEGMYAFVEVSAPAPYAKLTAPVCAHVDQATVNGGGTVTVTAKDQKLPNLTIQKLDKQTKQPIPGTVFEIKGIHYGYHQDVITGPDGKAVLTAIPVDSYEVKEISVPDPYVVGGETIQTIYLGPGDDQNLVFENLKMPQLTIYKEDSVAGAPVEGAKFHITYTSSGESAEAPGTIDYGNILTDAKGEIRLHEQGKRLYPGEYTVTEVEPAPGFQMKEPSTQKTILHGSESKTLTFQNTPLNAIVVEKYDSVTHEALPGCTFQLRFLGGTSGTGGTTIGQKVTGKNGTAIWTGLKSGTYIVEEVDPADGYSIINASETIYLADSGEQSVVTVRFDNAPDGILLVRKVCSVNPSVTLANAEFKITYADGTLIGDSNGIFRTDEHGEIRVPGLKPGKSVIVTETRAPDGYLIDTQSQTVQIKEGRTVSLTFKNQPKGKLIIQKRDSATGQPLPGAEFRVTTAAGCEVGLDGVIGSSTLTQNGIFTTDGQGEITITNLAPGAYVLTEIKAPTGYVMDRVSTNVVIGKNGDTQTVIVKNSKAGTLVIDKRDSLTGKPLQGVTFKVTTSTGEFVPAENGQISSNGLYFTDKDGKITIHGVVGTLVVTETATIPGYTIDEASRTQTVVVNPNDTQTLHFTNTPSTTLVIEKYIEGTTTPLKGVTFLVTDSSGAVVGNSNGEFITDENGRVVIHDLTPGTTVTAREVKTVEGFVLDGTPKSILIKAGEVQTLRFYNVRAGGLTVIKKDEKTGERIPGVQFEIRKMDGEIVGTFTTDENGVIYLPKAENGWYTVTERKAAEGYRLDDTPHRVEVRDGQTATLEITNKAISGILLHKVNAVTGEGIPGVSFILYDSGNDPIAQETSDDRGYVRFEGLEDGRYYLRELENEGYIPDTQKKTVYVKSGETTEIEWKNTPITGQIQVTKVSADYNAMNGWPAGTPIPNTVFEIYNARTNRLVDTIKTDKNGLAVSKPLPLARYKIVESKAAEFYGLDKTPIEVEIEYAGQIVKASMANKSLSTNVSIKKTGYVEVMPGQLVRYNFTGIANNSTTALESFYWRDTLPVKAVRLQTIYTGTWNTPGNYKIVYRTNLSGGTWRTLADNLSTSKNYVLDASPAALGLASNEYVTEFMAAFGIVPANFRQVEAPRVDCKALAKLTGGTQFVNTSDAGGVYNGQWIMATSRWVTRVYAPSKPLPRTGY
ncbi:SpaA isopeptide-forming pilin-related protein [Dysosmobacter sp.]|uniref:SpaA isopeptide-forming pilin-related protein n=1 Tax=Dysosmobacter sp. TaxID=2591382 RepID=UPI003AB6FA23